MRVLSTCISFVVAGISSPTCTASTYMLSSVMLFPEFIFISAVPSLPHPRMLMLFIDSELHRYVSIAYLFA